MPIDPSIPLQIAQQERQNSSGLRLLQLAQSIQQMKQDKLRGDYMQSEIGMNAAKLADAANTRAAYSGNPTPAPALAKSDDGGFLHLFGGSSDTSATPGSGGFLSRMGQFLGISDPASTPQSSGTIAALNGPVPQTNQQPSSIAALSGSPQQAPSGPSGTMDAGNIAAIQDRLIRAGHPEKAAELGAFQKSQLDLSKATDEQMRRHIAPIYAQIQAAPEDQRAALWQAHASELQKAGVQIDPAHMQYSPENLNLLGSYLQTPDSVIAQQSKADERQYRASHPDVPTGFLPNDPNNPQAGYHIDPAYQQFAMQKATAGKTVVNNNVNLAENSFAKGLGDGLSKDFMTRRQSAQEAVMSLQANNEARKLLDNGVITGAGADFKLQFGRLAQQAGFHYADDPIANTEAYVATRAKEVGRIIKLFGAGTGLSDADREYATKAAAGQITMNEQSMRKVMDISDRASTNIIKNFNTDASKVPAGMSPFPLSVEAPTFDVGPAPAATGAANPGAGQPAAAAPPSGAAGMSDDQLRQMLGITR